MTPTGVALVTGASRGLGRAIALELAAHGFAVVATMRDPGAGTGLPAEAAARGGRLRVERLDVALPETISIPEGLRVLVNNAGVDAAMLPVEAQGVVGWRPIFETNVFGLVEVTQRAIPALRRAGGGVVCNLTSSSLLAGVPFFALYRASKAAVAAFGDSLRAEVAPFGIRVLEVLPGPIATDMLAASDHLPEAAAVAGYAEMAAEFHASRRAIDALITPPAEAARRIVAAILDDASPERVACDPLGDAMLPRAGAR